MGKKTEGKNVGSITVYDYDEYGTYHENAMGKINTSHTWAMQPIVVKLANANGFSDFGNGIAPDVAAKEYDNLPVIYDLGNTNELLLSKAIERIDQQILVKSTVPTTLWLLHAPRHLILWPGRCIFPVENKKHFFQGKKGCPRGQPFLLRESLKIRFSRRANF
ncbi:MAG: hypothetical protein HC896_13300 [Bacteroidales bacterium]|nr:hypothetical protein [Bacteroidales bacterium]